MMDMIEIRRLQASDVEDYRTIRLAALKTEPDSFGSVHAAEVSRPITHFAERLSSSIVLGAYCKERIVGMAGFKQEAGLKDSHKGFVWGFYVAPEQRHQGLGSALIGALIEVACDSVEQLTLTVVRDNEAAIALYERHGFEIYGVEPRALKTSTGYSDEVLMVLFLQQV
jgi:ribosomal protein S18 acetylase RimI-like enzyme